MEPKGNAPNAMTRRRNVRAIILAAGIAMALTELAIYKRHARYALPTARRPTARRPTSRLPDPGPAPRSRAFCARLLASPAPFDLKCQRKLPALQCTDGRTLFFSQYLQDFYLYTRHFSRLKRRGIYLDVATYHPVLISNTYFLDDCLGWAGLCVEANPAKHALIRAARRCALLPTCVGSSPENVTFVLDDDHSAVEATSKWANSWRETRTINLTCTTLARELSRYAVSRVDYLSLDVEGHELHVLNGFDWDRVIVNVMSVETSDEKLPALQAFMNSKGYVRHIPDLDSQTLAKGLLTEDAIFLHKSVKFGRPE